MQIGGLKALRLLWLNDNMFKGDVPRTLVNLSELETCALQNNKLRGTVPAGLLTSLPNCRVFRLGGNAITGEVIVGGGSQAHGETSMVWLDLSMTGFEEPEETTHHLQDALPGCLVQVTTDPKVIMVYKQNNSITKGKQYLVI